MPEDKTLKPEDYVEPQCVLCMDDHDFKPIDTRRFIEKLDSYYSKTTMTARKGTLNTGFPRRNPATICADSSPFTMR